MPLAEPSLLSLKDMVDIDDFLAQVFGHKRTLYYRPRLFTTHGQVGHIGRINPIESPV
jgi:hypothetical protein